MIQHILYKDQIQYLRKEGNWPTNDPEFGAPDDGLEESAKQVSSYARDGIVYGDNYDCLLSRRRRRC